MWPGLGEEGGALTVKDVAFSLGSEKCSADGGGGWTTMSMY